MLLHCSDSEHYPKGSTMYLTTGDLLAVMIALVVSVTLVITTALANAKLTVSRDEYRKAWLMEREAK